MKKRLKKISKNVYAVLLFLFLCACCTTMLFLFGALCSILWITFKAGWLLTAHNLPIPF